jgi:hypothetical protein
MARKSLRSRSMISTIAPAYTEGWYSMFRAVQNGVPWSTLGSKCFIGLAVQGHDDYMNKVMEEPVVLMS